MKTGDLVRVTDYNIGFQSSIPENSRWNYRGKIGLAIGMQERNIYRDANNIDYVYVMFGEDIRVISSTKLEVVNDVG